LVSAAGYDPRNRRKVSRRREAGNPEVKERPVLQMTREANIGGQSSKPRAISLMRTAREEGFAERKRSENFRSVLKISLLFTGRDKKKEIGY